MSDFNLSIQQGIAAAKIAIENRNQVKSIFEEINSAISTESNGNARLEIVDSIQAMDGIEYLKGILDKKSSGQFLVIRNTKTKSFKKIAEWRQNESGYPCSIIRGTRHTSCADADSLRLELSDLLTSPIVGEAILETK